MTFHHALKASRLSIRSREMLQKKLDSDMQMVSVFISEGAQLYLPTHKERNYANIEEGRIVDLFHL